MEETPVEVVKKHPGGHHHRVVNLKKALSLRLKCLSYADIAKYFDVDSSTVFEALQVFGPIVKHPELLEAFKEHRNDINMYNQMACAAILPIKLKDKKTTAGNVAYAQDRYYQMERLEAGKSTSNISQLTHVLEHIEGSIKDGQRGE